MLSMQTLMNTMDIEGRRQARPMKSCSLRLPEPDNRAPSARPQGSTGLSAVDRPARWCVDESRISSSPHIDQGVDTQAATLRATRRTRPGTTSPASSTVATANRWHEHPDIVGEASTSLHVVSRTTPVWRNLEHNETSVTEPAETTNGCQIRRSPQSLCTTRPLTLADARSPKRAPSPPGRLLEEEAQWQRAAPAGRHCLQRVLQQANSAAFAFRCFSRTSKVSLRHHFQC